MTRARGTRLADEAFGEVLLSLRTWAEEHVGALVLGFVVLLLVQTVRLWIVRSAPALRVGRHQRLGKEGERRARSLLKKEGYRLCGEQQGGSYCLFVDGRATPIHLRSDYLVEKRGRRFVAEVKSGALSVKVTSRGTRRQLLEYLFAFDVDGVLLVDMHAHQIREISFPDIKSR